MDVKMEQIKGRKVVSIRRVGETTFTEIRRDLFSIIPGVLELRSQPEVYGNHLVTVCCGSNTSCFIGPTRTLFSIVHSSTQKKPKTHTIRRNASLYVLYDSHDRCRGSQLSRYMYPSSCRNRRGSSVSWNSCVLRFDVIHESWYHSETNESRIREGKTELFRERVGCITDECLQ